MAVDYQTHKAKSKEPYLPVVQTVKKHYALAANYQAYRLFNQSLRYDKTASSYIAELV